MSDQNKSNIQALGAGLFGFVAVMAVGGGALMFHSSQQARSAAAPAPAAAPIDLTSAMPRPSMAPSGQPKEGRESSPAPLIGDDGSSSDESAAPEAAPAPSAPVAAPRAAAPSPESAPAAKASALEVTRHLEAENSSTAEAVVRNSLEEKAAPKPQSKLPGKKAAKLEVPSGDGAVASSVHYGVTSRNELMGRAAGPVYNIAGGKVGEAKTNVGKMANDVDGRIADLRRQLEASGLPADQRAKLLKDLDDSLKAAAASGKTAQ